MHVREDRDVSKDIGLFAAQIKRGSMLKLHGYLKELLARHGRDIRHTSIAMLGCNEEPDTAVMSGWRPENIWNAEQRDEAYKRIVKNQEESPHKFPPVNNFHGDLCALLKRQHFDAVSCDMDAAIVSTATVRVGRTIAKSMKKHQTNKMFILLGGTTQHCRRKWNKHFENALSNRDIHGPIKHDLRTTRTRVGAFEFRGLGAWFDVFTKYCRKIKYPVRIREMYTDTYNRPGHPTRMVLGVFCVEHKKV